MTPTFTPATIASGLGMTADAFDILTKDYAIESGYNLRSVLKGEVAASFDELSAITRTKAGNVRVTVWPLHFCVELNPAEAGLLADSLIAE